MKSNTVKVELPTTDDRSPKSEVSRRILIVANTNKGSMAPFVIEQAQAIAKQGCEVAYFGVQGHGLRGYLRNYRLLKNAIENTRPDIIHAHYGFCGLLSNLQRRVPVVTTYHGSDINIFANRLLSIVSILLSGANIMVSSTLLNKVPLLLGRRRCIVQPCGINIDDFPFVEQSEARKEMGLDPDKKYVLFSSSFDNEVKNPHLAQASVAMLPGVELLELKGYTRQQVSLLMHAVDALLLTSHSEGSPQVVKEAMACGCPVVSVRVGNVEEMLSGVEGCYLAERDAKSISTQIQKALEKENTIDGRQRLVDLGMTNDRVAKKIVEVYKTLFE